MRGNAKRRRHGFAKGNQFAAGPRQVTGTDNQPPQRETIIRTDKRQFAVASTSAEPVPGPSGQLCDYTALRPRQPVTYYDTYEACEDSTNVYNLYHDGILCDFWNRVTCEHRDQHPHCSGYLRWCHGDAKLCEQRGMVWAKAVKCDKCPYVSTKEKFYEEVDTSKRGRKAAVPNIGLQVGLARQGMGPSGLIDVLSAANMSAPSKKGMQASANAVAPVLQEENLKDMHVIREELKEDNILRGNVKQAIDVESDGTYSTRYRGNMRNTPFQAATQATYIMAENMTKEKKIISVNTYNKLCCCSAKYDAGPHTSTCSQNLSHQATIGYESRYMEDAVGDVQQDGLNIEYLTLDGDSKARKLASELVNPCPDVQIKPQYCSLHLSGALLSKLRSTSFSDQMFAAAARAAPERDRNDIQRLFSLDVMTRVAAEYAAATKVTGDDTQLLVNKMSYMTDTVIECYVGANHDLCDQHSFVCKSTKPYRQFIATVSSLKNTFVIHPTSEDREELRAILALRFGPRSVYMARFNRTQNKCEAANRGIKKATPSHLTFARNYTGRVHAAVHSMNNGPGVSLLKLCHAAGAPIPAESPVIKRLKRMDADVAFQKERKSSPEYAIQRAAIRKRKFELHDEKKETTAEYKKNCDIRDLLLRSEEIRTGAEHSYIAVHPTDDEHHYQHIPARRIIRHDNLQCSKTQHATGKKHVSKIPKMHAAITATNLPT